MQNIHNLYQSFIWAKGLNVYKKFIFRHKHIHEHVHIHVDYMHVVTEHNFSKEVDIMCQG